MTGKEIQHIILAEIIAPSESKVEQKNWLPKDVRQQIYRNWKDGLSWDEVFSPIENEDLRSKYIELFKGADRL